MADWLGMVQGNFVPRLSGRTELGTDVPGDTGYQGICCLSRLDQYTEQEETLKCMKCMLGNFHAFVLVC